MAVLGFVVLCVIVLGAVIWGRVVAYRRYRENKAIDQHYQDRGQRPPWEL